MITVENIIQYILQNKKGNAFRGYVEFDIAESVIKAVNNNALIVCNDYNSITGIAIVYKKDECSIHVEQLLTTRPGAFEAILNLLYKLYGDKVYTAVRHDKLVQYSPRQFYNKIRNNNLIEKV